MKSEILRNYVEEYHAGRDLAEGDTENLFDSILAETNETLLADLLIGWESKGTTEDELFGLACVMRSRMKRITPRNSDVIDIVGTGGSRSKIFNVSTAAAFVVAGAGVPVAKHGNRAATSSSGSADVLALLDVKVNVSPEIAERCLNDLGICFMFAPRFHLLSPTLAKVRRELGRPTIFNNLGPLCNPAGAPHQIIGVWSGDLLEKSANVLARLGTKLSWIVHGESGLDEIALTGETQVAVIHDGQVGLRKIAAVDFGINVGGDKLLQSHSPGESATLIRKILENRLPGDDAEKLLLMNAAAAIFVAGKADDLRDAFALATESIRNGKAFSKLTALAAATNE